jgi:hypothetical protein
MAESTGRMLSEKDFRRIAVKLYNKSDVLSERVNARLKELVNSQGPEGGAD